MPDFGTLKTRIQSRINSNDTDTAFLTLIGDSINSSIDFFEEKHFWFNESSSITNLIIGDIDLPNIPADFLFEREKAGLVLLDNNLSYPLQKISHEERSSIDTQTKGRPRFYDVIENTILLYPIPDQAYQLTLYYIKEYTDLVNDTDINDWTNNADRLIESKSLADLYLDQRHGMDMSDRYEIKVKRELSALSNKNNKKIATARLKTPSLNYNNGYRRNGFFVG